MAKTAKQKLVMIFWAIAAFSAFGAFYVLNTSMVAQGSSQTYLAIVATMVVMPLALEAMGAAGLALGIFMHHALRPGIVIRVFKSVTAAMDMLAIFDLVLRIFAGRIETSAEKAVLITDGTIMILFILWRVVAYLVEQDWKQRRVADFY